MLTAHQLLNGHEGVERVEGAVRDIGGISAHHPRRKPEIVWLIDVQPAAEIGVRLASELIGFDRLYVRRVWLLGQGCDDAHARASEEGYRDDLVPLNAEQRHLSRSALMRAVIRRCVVGRVGLLRRPQPEEHPHPVHILDVPVAHTRDAEVVNRIVVRVRWSQHQRGCVFILRDSVEHRPQRAGSEFKFEITVEM